MRVLRGPVYRSGDANIIESKHDWYGFTPIVTVGEKNRNEPVARAMMQALGYSRWYLLILLYSQEYLTMPCTPVLATYEMGGPGYKAQYFYRIKNQYNPFSFSELGQLEAYNERLMASIEKRLRRLQIQPELVVLSSFCVPINPKKLWDKYMSKEQSPPVIYYGMMEFIYRVLSDLPEHFRRSGDPELANASVLAEFL